MTSQEREKIIDRIRKLLALSKSPNEHEAASAAEKAQALLLEYNLSRSELEGSNAKLDEGYVINSELVTESVPWRRGLVGAVARLYLCSYFFKHQYHDRPNSRKQGAYLRTDEHFIVGTPSNVNVAQMMAKYLMDTVDRLARDAAATQHVNRSAYATSFKHGCAIRLWRRIMDRIEDAKRGTVKTESGTTLPACLDLYERTQKQLSTFIEQNVGKLKVTKSRAKSSSAEGYRAGVAAGDKVGLDGQVGTSHTRRIGVN